MPHEQLPDWPDIGARIAQARQMLGLTQAEMATRTGLQRTAINRIESGSRAVSAMELAGVAQVTGIPIDWFVTESPPTVASRRASSHHETNVLDVQVEVLARELTQLIALDLLRPAGNKINLAVPKTLGEAESAALQVRAQLGCDTNDLIDLSSASRELGLFPYSIELSGSQADGAYVAIDDAMGVALVNGSWPSGRRRFTLAHEIGHHIFQDAYAVDIDLAATGNTERLINAFAIHLLLPQESLKQQWHEFQGQENHRQAAIAIAARNRLSWTALSGHLVNISLLGQHAGEVLREARPRKGEYLELGVSFLEELAPPSLPQAVVEAVLRGYRRHRLGTGRTLELLHGILAEEDLPEQDELPRAALAGELRSE